MKIYTRTGDDGTTSLFSGGRVSKAHLRVESYGTVDELNSVLGVVRGSSPTAVTDQRLHRIQNELFRLGADLATPMEARPEWLVRMDGSAVERLEAEIDEMDHVLEPLRNFILPGGTTAAAHLHIARTVCRRAERMVVAVGEHEAINSHALHYLNRLSDWLFTTARFENQQAGISEEKWYAG